MPLVKVVPHMVLHQKMHVPVSVNFLESEMAFQHPVVSYDPFSIMHYHAYSYCKDCSKVTIKSKVSDIDMY